MRAEPTAEPGDYDERPFSNAGPLAREAAALDGSAAPTQPSKGDNRGDR